MGQLSNYNDFVLQLSKEAPHLYRALAMLNDSVAAAQTFELRTDELKVIESLRRIEEQAVRAQAKETFHTEFGRERYNKRHLGFAQINIWDQFLLGHNIHYRTFIIKRNKSVTRLVA